MFNVPLNNVLAYKTINRTKTRIKPVHTHHQKPTKKQQFICSVYSLFTNVFTNSIQIFDIYKYVSACVLSLCLTHT